MKFTWRQRELELFDHPHNATATNERAVEVPIARAWLEDCAGVGLELGNVLGHYGPGPARVIIDRYESADGVCMRDVFDLGGHYPWIVSISTIEHVRWDETVRNRNGGAAALLYLAGLLEPGGRMLVTVPFGINGDLDELLAEQPGRFGEAHASAMVRCYSGWQELGRAARRPYGPVGANAVWVGTWG